LPSNGKPAEANRYVDPPFAANEHNLRPDSRRGWRNRSGGHPLRFRPTAVTESGNRRASRLGRQWLNDLLRRRVQEQRERAERERIRAEAARLATIEEGCLKPVLGGWVEQLQKFRSAYPRPRPSDARRSRDSLLPARSLIKDVNGAAVCVEFRNRQEEVASALRTLQSAQ
jgi:hypothetical protein